MTYAILDRYSGEKIGPSHDTLEAVWHEARARKFTQQGIMYGQTEWAQPKHTMMDLLLQNYEIKEEE